MNFGLSKKFAAIDFEEISVSDLMLIGGGCGGGGGSTSVQTAAQTAAQAPNANSNVSVTVQTPGASGSVTVNFGYSTTQGGYVNGTANVSGTTGGVTVNASGSGSGGFWSTVVSFFGWLFGSH